MMCIFHKWDGCTCTKCSKVRDEKHKWKGCKCIGCGKERDMYHNYSHGKCIGCGKISIKEGHSKDVYYKLNKDNSDLVDIYCSDCKTMFDTKKYNEVYDRYLEEIKNADAAGCDAPIAEGYLEKLRELRKK